MDRRINERHIARFQVRLTDLASPEVSASGQGIDISKSGIGVFLPLKFTPGSAVELNINDSALFGVVTHSIPERSYFRTGIEVWQVLIGRSELAELLKETLREAMPNQQLEYSDPTQFQ
jgi:PilZ domain